MRPKTCLCAIAHHRYFNWEHRVWRCLRRMLSTAKVNSSFAFWTSLDRAAQTTLWESIDQSILGAQIPYLINLMTQLISAAQRRRLPTISTTSTSPYARAERGSHYVHRRVVILKTKPNWTLSRPLGWDPNLIVALTWCQRCCTCSPSSIFCLKCWALKCGDPRMARAAIFPFRTGHIEGSRDSVVMRLVHSCCKLGLVMWVSRSFSSATWPALHRHRSYCDRFDRRVAVGLVRVDPLMELVHGDYWCCLTCFLTCVKFD